MAAISEPRNRDLTGHWRNAHVHARVRNGYGTWFWWLLKGDCTRVRRLVLFQGEVVFMHGLFRGMVFGTLFQALVVALVLALGAVVVTMAADQTHKIALTSSR